MPEGKSKFLKDLIDKKGPETEAKSFTAERQHTAQAFNLHIERKDGRRSEGFAWSHYVGYQWTDEGEHERLVVLFGARAIEIEGHHLTVLIEEIREGQLNSIRELVSGKAMLLQQANPDNEPVISSVKTYPDFEEILRKSKETTVKLDTLDALKDEELQSVIERAQTLLKQRDDDRKAKALEQARTLLASVGLSMKDLNGKGKTKGTKGSAYHGGTTYQHPGNKALTWNGKGKHPSWLVALEAEGGKAVERD